MNSILNQYKNEQEYLEAITAYDRILSALKSLADLYTRLSQYSEAQKLYIEGISAYDRVLCLDPNNIYAFNNKGNALLCFGHLLKNLFQHQEALQCYQAALTAFNHSDAIAPNDEHIQSLREQTQQLLKTYF